MGLICEYFAAPSDTDATAVLDREQDSSEAIGRPSSQPVKRSLFRRRSRPAEEPRREEPESAAAPSPAYPTVDGGGVEPIVQMGTLEAALTGRSFDDVMADRADDGVIADRDGGERLVVRLAATLSGALADADMAHLATVAIPWSQTEEFWGQGDPEDLAALLGRLADLARDARARGWSLYCHVSL